MLHSFKSIKCKNYTSTNNTRNNILWLNFELILLKVFEDNFTDVAFGDIVVVIYSKVEAFSRQNFEANLGGKFLRQENQPLPWHGGTGQNGALAHTTIFLLNFNILYSISIL